MQGDGEVGTDTKWVTHYCSDHKILLVGEGDFSFSLSLARSFASASNIVATSLDSYDDVTKKYKHAKSNLDNLKFLGACLLHGVDATKMKVHSYLKAWRFDRIIFNFPHAGFHGKEDDSTIIEMHKNLVLGFFENASCLLRFNGEIHVNHKTNAPFCYWNIEELAIQSFLTLIECVNFRKNDYPGYNNKRGDSNRCDEPFPLGKCSTFKFVYNPIALGKLKRINHVTYRQQRNLPFQQIQEAVENLPTSVDFSYYPQTNHFSRLNDAMSSTFGLTNGHTPTSGSYLNNAALVHERVASCASYFDHGMNLGSQRSLQPLQPMQSFGARNEGHKVFGGDSNDLQEAPGRTAENYGYSFERVRSDSERYIHEAPRRTVIGARYDRYGALGGSSNYLQEAPGRTAEYYGYPFDRVSSDSERYIHEAPRRTVIGARYDGYGALGGSSNYWQEAPGRTSEYYGYSFDRVRSDSERYIHEAPRRTLSGARSEGYHSHGGSSNYLQEARGRTYDNAGYSFDMVRSDIERCHAEIPRTFCGARKEGYRALGGSSNYLQEAPGRMAEIAGYSFGARNEGHQVFGGDSNYWQEACGRTSENAGYLFDRVRSDSERYIMEVPENFEWC